MANLESVAGTRLTARSRRVHRGCSLILEHSSALVLHVHGAPSDKEDLESRVCEDHLVRRWPQHVRYFKLWPRFCAGEPLIDADGRCGADECSPFVGGGYARSRAPAFFGWAAPLFGLGRPFFLVGGPCILIQFWCQNI